MGKIKHIRECLIVIDWKQVVIYHIYIYGICMWYTLNIYDIYVIVILVESKCIYFYKAKIGNAELKSYV